MSEQLQKSVQKLRKVEAFADATNYPSIDTSTPDNPSMSRGAVSEDEGGNNFDEAQIDDNGNRTIRGEKVKELKDAGLSHQDDWVEDVLPATSHDIALRLGREFEGKHASEVGYRAEIIEPKSYNANVYKYEPRPDMTYVNNGRVEVKRAARDKDGNVTEGTVKQLTGRRAERATEILANRAARLLGQSASRRVANLQEQYLDKDTKE